MPKLDYVRMHAARNPAHNGGLGSLVAIIALGAGRKNVILLQPGVIALLGSEVKRVATNPAVAFQNQFSSPKDRPPGLQNS